MVWAAMRADGRIVYQIIRDFYEGGRTQITKVINIFIGYNS